MSIKIIQLDDISTFCSDLAESGELECKLGLGRNQKGEIPKDLWETYSAFANTRGGVILLGVREQPRGNFFVEGIPLSSKEKLIQDLFNTLNNSNKVSTNLVTENDVTSIEQGELFCLQIRVPQATRNQKPVYINNNPVNGSYRRLNEADVQCDHETVKRMLAENIEEERDRRILKGFSWDDIDKTSIRVYRQMFKDAKPSHPFLEEDDFGFFKKIGGWRRDRESGEEGVTLAGLLMFGTWEAIQEATPNYFVDYQERPEAKTELRWIDRLVPDGTWSGNLFDFYRIVYKKLTDPAGLKIPFKLKSGQRKDDTPVHEAIREALVNTIVHADYSGRLSVLIVKRPDLLGFRNPGNMRIPIERALSGGETDCRNRLMHQMFLMIGVGERAGSGIPKIYNGWKWRQWRTPLLYERDEPAQTLLELRMLDLFPVESHEYLQGRFGDSYLQLPQLERLILTSVATEQVVSHGRISTLTTAHTHDISQAFKKLVKNEMLQMQGHGRGAVYHLPGVDLPTPEQVFGGRVLSTDELTNFGESASFSGDNSDFLGDNGTFSGDNGTFSGDNGTFSGDNAVFLGDNGVFSGDNGAFSGDNVGLSTKGLSETRDKYGRQISELLSAPVVKSLNELEKTYRLELESIASLPRKQKRVSPETIREIILKVCSGQYVTKTCLGDLLKRTPETLRRPYLNNLLSEGLISLAFPQSPNHPHQAYISTESLREVEKNQES